MEERKPATLAEMKAALPGASGLLDGLLGCAWGKRVAVEGDTEPCPEQARKIMILHAPPGLAPDASEFRFCDAHHAKMMELTSSHLDGVGAVEVNDGSGCPFTKTEQLRGVLRCSRPRHNDDKHWDAVTDSVWWD